MSQLRTATTPSGTTSIGHVHEQTMISKITTRNNHWISRKGTVDFAQNMVEVDPLSVPSPILNDAVSPMSSNGWMYETLYYNSNGLVDIITTKNNGSERQSLKFNYGYWYNNFLLIFILCQVKSDWLNTNILTQTFPITQ